MTGRVRSERGQVSSEAMGVLFVVALIIGALVATGISGDIARGMSDAICRISGGDCEEQTADAEPDKCLVSQTTSSANAEVFIAFVEIGKTSTLLKEIHSDGSVTYTIVDNDSVAGKLFAGGKAKVGRYGASLSAEASAGGQLEGARVYEFPSEEAAKEFEDNVQAAGGFDGILRDITHANDEFPLGIPNPAGAIDDWVLDQVGVDDDRDLPDPDATYLSGSVFLDGEGSAGAGAGGVDGELAAAIKGAGGVRHYTSGERDGESDVFIKLNADATGTLTSTLFDVGGGLGGDGEAVVTLTLDKNNEPKEFSVKVAAGYTGSLDLSAALQGKDGKAIGKLLAEGAITGSEGSGQKIEVEGKLDLTDPANRDAVLALLGPGAGRVTGAIDVAQRLNEDGELTLDTSTTSESEGGAEVKVGAGVGGGGGLTTSDKEENRTAGFERPPGGTWGPRVCKGPASP